MTYPDLESDESIILETRNVKFKSISFDAILTTRRIILTGSKRNIIPSQEIDLETIRNVETGENAIRDHFLILTIIAGTGEKQETVLTFLREAGGERKRECSEWAKKIKNLIPSSAPVKVPPHISVPDRELLTKHEATTPAQAGATGTRHGKKNIEIARPLGKIVEKSPVSPIPKETTSLPSGTFCSRCGNRVPLKSTFCNHCGTPIKQLSDLFFSPQPIVTRTEKAVPPPESQPTVVKVLVPPLAGTTGGRQDRPLEQIIHSIEPLIEDSVPRTQPSSRIQKHPSQQTAEQAPSESPAASPPPVLWPVLQKSESPILPVEEPAVTEPGSPPPHPNDAPALKQPNYLAIGILVIAILAVIGGLVVVANFMPGQSGVSGETSTTSPVTTQVTKLTISTPQTTPSPVVTIAAVPTTTQVIIPSTGVWVRVSYPGTYNALIGTPGNQIEVRDTGDHVYQIATNDGYVAATIEKRDGTANKIILEVYKNGVLLKRGSTVTPNGIVDIQLDLKSVQTGNSTSG